MLIIIPLKKKKKKFKKKKKKKVFIAYYKNGKKTYTVLSKKNYKKKLRSNTEEGFLTHLEVLFDYIYGKIDVNKKSILYKASCRDVVIIEDYENCFAIVQNTCSHIVRTINRLGKNEVCGGEFDEIILDAPLDPDECPDGYEEGIHGGCVPISNDGNSDNDSSTGSDDPNDPDTGGCDEMDYDCDEGDGSAGDNPVDEACEPGKVKNTNGDCECPQGTVEDASGNCVISNDTTPCEMAFLARDVANIENGTQADGSEPIPSKLSGGWELNTTLNLSQLTLTDNDSGFNSAVYQKLVNGVYQYMYITQGSELSDYPDWVNNANQLSGNSEQYDISVENAQRLDEIVGENSSLIFVGHSLGGGLASVNALTTGRTAYTYNAAGLSNATRDEYDAGLYPDIFATVVTGEFVDTYQRKYFGIKAESSWGINYVDKESKAWVDFLNRFSPVIGSYNQVRLHLIESVLAALGCIEN